VRRSDRCCGGDEEIVCTKPGHIKHEGSGDGIGVYSLVGNIKSVGEALPFNADRLLRGHKELIAIKLGPCIKIITTPRNDSYNMDRLLQTFHYFLANLPLVP
jgi:hypothetical protein